MAKCRLKNFRELRFNDKLNCISIGKLSPDMIDFICSKNPDIGQMLSSDIDILFWKDRIKHTELHKNDFISDNMFYNCFENIPEIIQSPDYISTNPKGNSISFIRKLSQYVSVVVRISIERKLSYRTMYPLMDAQLSNYIKKGQAWKYEKEN